ncbi:hypothetical protein PR202_ga24528 [Eleusine coracana subsp. coracana]|uniref:ER membrane protein complex subunit 10 n=1 Tax=Eleusine coracana subsp. coracana TaxID=191504 RepID=A0AAV5D953_ELECO|nr:hypothetical protein PR202_ga24528 [Eleusine coracana subsp. coracana]
MATPRRRLLLLALLAAVLSFSLVSAFQSDELVLNDDDEFEGVGARPASPSPPVAPAVSSRRRSADASPAGAGESNAVQFTLEHDLGDGKGFVPAGSFSARLKSTAHGSQTLTKLRFTRNELAKEDKDAFKKLLQEDGFYTIRLPSNVLDPKRNDYVVSSIKARCIPRDSLDEHIVIHMDGVNILAVNYGSVGGCQYPRPMKLVSSITRIPSKWTFNSYTVLKTAEQAPRLASNLTIKVVSSCSSCAPKHLLTNLSTLGMPCFASQGHEELVHPSMSLILLMSLHELSRAGTPCHYILTKFLACRTPSFADQLIEAENGLGEVMKPPEKSFWAKYWMYIIPLGLIVMNAVTAAANIPEEQAAGQGQAGAQRAPAAAARRR